MCFRTHLLCSLQWMPQQVIDLGEGFRLWQKTIWALWIAENKVMAVVVVWKQMDWISCSHESTNSRAVCHMLAVIWPLVIDSWLQCLFAAALLCVNFLIPLLTNLEVCCHESKLPSRAWRKRQDELFEGSLQPWIKQTYHLCNHTKTQQITHSRNKQKSLNMLKLKPREFSQEQIKGKVYLYHRMNSGMQSCPSWRLTVFLD